jgi:uncharacterized membrane protein
MKIMIVNEPIWKSIIKDGITFLLVIFGFWLNYKFLGNSGWFQFCMAFIFILLSIAVAARIKGKDVQSFEDIKSAKEYLNSLKD